MPDTLNVNRRRVLRAGVALVAAAVAQSVKVGQLTGIIFDQDKLMAFDRTTKARLL